LIAALLTPAKAKEHHKFCHRPARTHSGRLGIMKTGDFQMPFFGENYFAAATSLTGLRRAGHSIWLRASTTALLSLVSSVSAGITSSRHDAHLDKLRPNASHRLHDPCVEGRAFTAANQNFAEEIRNRQPGVKKVLDQPLG
jgi:hypothetical protein